MDKPVSFKEVMRASKYCGPNKKPGAKPYPLGMTSKIMAAYFKVVIHTVLAGFVFKLPNDCGVLFIQKNKLTPKHKTSYHLTKKRFLSEPKITWRFGYWYEITLVSAFVSRQGFQFRACQSFRSQLHQKLKTTNFDYRTSLPTI